MSTGANTVNSPLPFRTFIADVDDRPGTLNRVVSLFRRRNYNIESLSVGRTERPGVSRVTVVVRADEDTGRRIEALLIILLPKGELPLCQFRQSVAFLQ